MCTGCEARICKDLPEVYHLHEAVSNLIFRQLVIGDLSFAQEQVDRAVPPAMSVRVKVLNLTRFKPKVLL